MHGIPGDRVLRDGDLISIDCGAIVDGWHGDAAITVGVGDVGPELARADAGRARRRSWRGLAAARLGGRVTDISHAIESYVRWQGDYGIVEDYVGHGIGSAMHMPPNVPNYGRPGPRPEAGRRHGARGRADDHARHDRDRSSTTTGPSSPTTARGRPTSSTRSRLTPEARCAHRPRRRRDAARRARRSLRRLTELPNPSTFWGG